MNAKYTLPNKGCKVVHSTFNLKCRRQVITLNTLFIQDSLTTSNLRRKELITSQEENITGAHFSAANFSR